MRCFFTCIPITFTVQFGLEISGDIKPLNMLHMGVVNGICNTLKVLLVSRPTDLCRESMYLQFVFPSVAFEAKNGEAVGVTRFMAFFETSEQCLTSFNIKIT